MIEFHNWPDWAGLDKKEVSSWLGLCAETYGFSTGKLSYTFLENASIRQVNNTYLEHDYPTDIITFDYSHSTRIEAEIYIGEEIVRENAIDFGVSQAEELCRVLAHGILHIIGFDDQSKEQRTTMRENEDKCLLLRPKNLINK